ncbi:MAG: PilT/PilU family type 4a pilus ATPase [Lentisphaerae bacterium]|jgi:twitching motility protein PilT|nr:PilT/PilU family type 4a pilus ATPase [Lentisphaerota bacterium]MBT4817354.1 PilT/PilU family type 4a pilus ATPase [Lentisphaerota bacterium]MBT5608130.1 PilT/PilU family type 4a pilus ATPase [Lentisphaerota bacterium]MBT7060593.1 PilT/PilU family type 4a pilus ATPase [Lentisphaerota bacterium]MBT7847692.1 PilT/PilU family type 4a pilus ATPase [Lentisphaerota bacterium]
MAASLLHDILATGVTENASDWHIREDSNPRLRIDGVLVEIDFCTTKEFLDDAMKQVAEEIHWKSYEETGDADFAFEEDNVGRFRANLHKQRGKMALTLRHVKSETPNLSGLGLPEIVKNIAENKNGIVFVTGTTGSGKSTTLAGMIGHMNEHLNRHIITIEDPIEYTFEDGTCTIEQREVGLDSVSFESALIHVLRQDPDAIIIGEMRSRTTFETALTAAETGHLVMTTLHTQTAAQSILRILDMYPNEERDSVRKSLASSLRAIICQRLVPKATGQGVVPAIEVLINTPIVQKLIQENRLEKLNTAIDGGEEDGMISFNRCLLQLVNSASITEEAAMRISDSPQALEMNLKGIFLSSGGGGIIN